MSYYYSSNNLNNKLKRERSRDNIEFNKDNPEEINRKKICPFLIRVFYNFYEFNKISSFDTENIELNDLHIYTWMDSDLKELTELIIGALKKKIKKKKVSLTFSLIYRDLKGKLQRREIGEICLNEENDDQNKTLKMANFKVGDFLDVKIKIKN